MRPLELTLEGFKSYRDSHTFSFEDRTLFGIVGPTGSGKSSILESLLFAFFGKTPRVERDTKKLINSEEDEAKVKLSFEVDDSLWSITRVIRRKGPSQVVLQNLTGSGEQITGDKNANDKITEVLGLDFAAFCASISLPQGEFDRFLRATPKQRTEILKGLFRLHRVDDLRASAKGHLALISAQLQMLHKQLDDLPAEPETLLGSVQESLKQASIKAHEIAAELPAIRRAEQDLDQSAEKLKAIDDQSTQIRQVLGRLPSEDSIAEQAASEQTAFLAHQEAEKALDAAGRALRAANDAQNAIELQGRGEAWCARVEAAIVQTERLAKETTTLNDALAGLDEQLVQLEARLKQDQSLFAPAETEAVEAEASLTRVRELHAAHMLRGELMPGQPCPVCENTVTELPPPVKIASLDNAVNRCGAAKTALNAAREKLDMTKQQLALVKDRRQTALERAQQTATALIEAQAHIAGLIPGNVDAPAELARARLALEQTRRAAAAAFSAHESAAAREKSERLKLQEAASRGAALSSQLSHICGRLGVDSAVVQEEGLLAGAKKAREAGVSVLESLERQIAAIKQTAESALGAIENFRRRFNAGPQAHASDVLAAAKGEISQLEIQIEQLKRAIATATECKAEITTLSKQEALYQRLIVDLTDSKFTAYLLEEQRQLLSRLASEKFLELTGHYVFSDDGSFEVLDQRTGARRTAETLSGGESFLASLSLALALAEAVAQQGGRLGCFFLDEGFGSLDAESLDLALEGIEALAVPGRLIGLISHVGGIQSRLDDLIVLERHDDGSTGVAQYEGPIGYAPAVI